MNKDLIFQETFRTPVCIQLLKSYLPLIKPSYWFGKIFFHFSSLSTSANILLTDTYVPKISDFGLARASVTFTQTIMTDRVVGTAAYMAPEALRGEITPKSDIFSFGVVSRMFKAI